MKKGLGFLLVVFFAGCAGVGVSRYTIEQPRVDTEIEGNQGYLFGQPPDPAARKSRLGPTRRISVIELEFGPEEDLGPVIKPKPKEEVYRRPAEPKPPLPVVKTKPVKPPHSYEYKSYTVEDGDTLQKISEKFYGTTRRWQFLFEENKNVLESPDKIYPGMKIKIPVLR